jgi:nitroreductase
MRKVTVKEVIAEKSRVSYSTPCAAYCDKVVIDGEAMVMATSRRKREEAGKFSGSRASTRAPCRFRRDGRPPLRARLPAATRCRVQVVEDILAVARRAPSGTNLQPWRVHVLTGASRQRLVDAVCAAYDAAAPGHTAEYDYYPAEFFEPYLARRRKIGWGLYGLLGIEKSDATKMRMKSQMRRNYQFFDAPRWASSSASTRAWAERLMARRR